MGTDVIKWPLAWDSWLSVRVKFAMLMLCVGNRCARMQGLLPPQSLRRARIGVAVTVAYLAILMLMHMQLYVIGVLIDRRQSAADDASV